MKTLLTTVGLVLLVGQTASAGTFHVGSGSLKARVEHPFHVVELTTTDLKASFAIDWKDPKGAMLEARVPTGPLLDSNPIGGFLRGALPGELVFRSLQVETLVADPGLAAPPPAFQVTFRGNLVTGQKTADARVQLLCLNDPPAIRCVVRSRVPMTALGLAVPRLLWVSAKDEVAVEGEVFFAQGDNGGAK